MNFLAPLFLLGGLALAAPIVFHLVRRATREKIPFSSLMFLLPSPPRLSRRHRLEHILLLILRCAALALLALGFARPFLSQAPVDDPTSAQPKRVVVLLDTSASMRRDGLWPAARERVGEILRGAGPADQVAILAFDRGVTPLVRFEDWNRAAPGDRVAFALGRLSTLSPSWAGTRLGHALTTAAETLAEEEGKASPGPRQIALVSDMQAGARLDTLQAYEWPKGITLRIETLSARRPTNAGVQAVADGPDSPRAADAPARVRVTNSSDSTREQFQLAWARPAAQPGAAPEFAGAPLDIYVPPGQSRVFAVPTPAGVSGLTTIALRGDDEAFDNVAHVAPVLQQRVSAIWLGDDAPEDTRRPLFFLRRALVETPRVAVRVTAFAPSAPLPPDELAGAGVIFVADALPAETVAAVRARAMEGKTIVFAPKQAGGPVAATLAALAGRPSVRLEEGRLSSYAMLAEIDFRHPLFAPFADPRYSDFTKIHFWKYRRLDAADLPGARVVAKFDSGDPAWIELPLGRGRLCILAAGWHPEDSQLAVSSKFVPLLWSLLELGGGLGAFATQHAIGDTVSLPADSTVTAVRGPDGAMHPLAAGATEFPATTQPGLYELIGGTRPLRFAVNLDANESRTSPLGVDELEQLGVPVSRAAQVETTPLAGKTLLQGVETENRQKLWRWFIAATLALLLAETTLAGRATRRASVENSEAIP